MDLRTHGRTTWYLPVVALLATALLGFVAIPASAKGGPSNSRKPPKSSTTTTTTTIPPPTTSTTAAPGPGTVLLRDRFDVADSLVTNEYAYWNPGRSDAVVSPTWEMTSGSLFAHAGAGWTGRPDDVTPDAGSTGGTNSAVFRLTTKRSDFENVAVDFSLSNLAFTSTATTPAVAWDGVHVLLRYQGQESLYYASVNRRDGTVAIKKKVPGGPSNGGTYYTLATANRPFALGSAQTVRATVMTNADGSVAIKLYTDGALVVQATDSGTGGSPITHAGAVGIRGDNDEFRFDDFTVTSL